MTDAPTPGNHGGAASGEPAIIPSSQDGAASPSQNEKAEREGQQVQKNREPFIYGSIKRLTHSLDRHSGAVTAGATVVIALATIVNVIYVGGQLSEMKSGVAQNDKLIASNADLATAAKTQGEAAKEQAKTASASLTANERAWVGTVDANIVKGPLYVPIVANVLYVNSGREPARFSIGGLEIAYTKDSWNDGSAVNDIVKRQEDCVNGSSIDGFRFAWPTTGFTQYVAHFPEGKIPQVGVVTWSDRINRGLDIVSIQGCIAYETFGAIHHTAFCYDYDANISDPNHLNICTVGSRVN
jgi:hypothetical protein